MNIAFTHFHVMAIRMNVESPKRPYRQSSRARAAEETGRRIVDAFVAYAVGFIILGSVLVGYVIPLTVVTILVVAAILQNWRKKLRGSGGDTRPTGGYR